MVVMNPWMSESFLMQIVDSAFDLGKMTPSLVTSQTLLFFLKTPSGLTESLMRFCLVSAQKVIFIALLICLTTHTLLILLINILVARRVAIMNSGRNRSDENSGIASS